MTPREEFIKKLNSIFIRTEIAIKTTNLGFNAIEQEKLLKQDLDSFIEEYAPKNDCSITGCRNLKTICQDCGRCVCEIKKDA